MLNNNENNMKLWTLNINLRKKMACKFGCLELTAVWLRIHRLGCSKEAAAPAALSSVSLPLPTLRYPTTGHSGFAAYFPMRVLLWRSVEAIEKVEW